MSNKVVVENMIGSPVGFKMPGSAIVKMWEKKGQKLSFNRDELIEAYFAVPTIFLV